MSGKTKRITDDSPAPVVVPVVLGPVEVRVPLASDTIEVRDVRIAARILPLGAIVSGAIRATTLRILSGLYLIRDLKSSSTGY